MSRPATIRAITVALIWRDDCLLVGEGWDEASQRPFYRPLGGGIDFGETSRAALVREFQEELGAELRELRYLATLENIFTYRERPGHEVVFVYEATLADPALYEAEALTIDENGLSYRALWRPIHTFDPVRAPLYPVGLPELLVSLGKKKSEPRHPAE